MSVEYELLRPDESVAGIFHDVVADIPDEFVTSNSFADSQPIHRDPFRRQIPFSSSSIWDMSGDSLDPP
jgi:hypothetical protein